MVLTTPIPPTSSASKPAIFRNCRMLDDASSRCFRMSSVVPTIAVGNRWRRLVARDTIRAWSGVFR